MARRKLKKEEMRTDPFRQFLARTFAMTENSLEHHWQAYAAGFIAVVAAVAGIYYYIGYLHDKNDASSALLSEVIETSEAPVLKPGDPQREDYLKSGMKVFTNPEERSSELKKKIDELQAKGASDDQEKAARYLKAADLAMSGSQAEALKILDELEKDSSIRTVAIGLKARIAESQKDAAKAESLYTQLSKMNSDDLPEPMGLNLLGQFYERQGRKAEAVQAYEEALKKIETARKSNAENGPGKPPAPKNDQMESRLKDRVRELKA
ncbi:MAG TPA: tetratricopeptide repeat protein [Acidobacteriota bacterium]|nr:tetratricopeptide repeat protein [Acidobacteriota bacterium]HQQ45835.1 tetratricopeptide repeat protein [Acidobacteriota bacterium]